MAGGGQLEAPRRELLEQPTPATSNAVMQKKTFTAVPPVESGFTLKGDVKDLKLLQLANGNKMILAAVNNDSLRVFRISK